ncbi:hopene-associated glycosyltransferase HpnB [Zymomonas mobilis]|uniref:glycosyltransferase n=1 Tax=Zymomonas mobilis TaxID=542 RepID=UPI00026D7E7E|nr:glycosyltransferase [Zymomonas mobilis]AFN56327.1 hopene-associated glycosyltransferase HpnB [Zymomonas mobilis subsp. mobilis ATCC 29191]TQK78243.1 hopene-associated glycosyltransferase HpnB [Zymomonas mobilis]TQL15111.1 hopene-associated glycosyltransferase HpnB [Zymomonas mobilis]GEB87564.1 glycosyl transferase [Zymomonas mobilis subsp. mobilis]
MVATILGLTSLSIWIGLLFFHGGFWLCHERDDRPVPSLKIWPDVVAIVPARNEADVIDKAIDSLLRQDYPGNFKVILVDDNSEDRTAEVAKRIAGTYPEGKLTIVNGSALPKGWAGKLWALDQGIKAAGQVKWLWLTDADIAHQDDTLKMLVAHAEKDGLIFHSLMARLSCNNFAEWALIPAFVFFFQMLYPFRHINNPKHKTAGAAGGCMLADRASLEKAGGIGAIRHAIIDDCSLGGIMKKQGKIRLSLTNRSLSIRPYLGFQEIGHMISRSAYAQLRYSFWLLALTLFGMCLVYLVPPALALLTHGVSAWIGLAGWMMMALAFQPILHFYHRSPLWGLALPLIAAFYSCATFFSAVHVWQGRGGMWKGRAQARIGL